MMSLVWTDELPLDPELARLTRSVKQDGPFAWQFDMPSDAALRGTARIEPDWLLFDTPLRRGRSRLWPEYDRLAQLLELNAILPPGVKYTWNRGEQLLHVQAEVPLGPDLNPLAKLDALFAGFQIAFDAYLSLRVASTKSPESFGPGRETGGHGGCGTSHAGCETASDSTNGRRDAIPAAPVSAANSSAPNTSTERRDVWKRLCEETGWACHERAGDRLAVSLDVPGSFVAAMLEPHNGVGLRARLEMDADFPTPVAKKGAAALLLSAGRVVRMARTYVSGAWRNGSQKPSEGSPASSEIIGTADAGPAKFGWDVVFGESPAAHELDRGLSALSMAARLTLGEMRVLADDTVARHFLVAQGMVL